MPAFVLLLRGVNVGGARKLPMKSLVSTLESIGATAIQTYKQSGNAVFSMKGRASASTLVTRIEGALAEVAGVETSALVFTMEEITTAASGNPFLAAGAEAKELHVTFLGSEPEPAKVAAFSPPTGEKAEYQLSGKFFFLRLPAGYSDTKLTNDFVSRKLGVSATTRNWNTVTALAEMALRDY